MTPIPTVPGLSLGYIHRSPGQIHNLQVAATNGQHGFKFYLIPLAVLQNTLPSYRFTGEFTVISLKQGQNGSPTPTPKPYVAPNGIPAISVIVRYQGHTYKVVMEQVAKKGFGGIWLIVQVGPRIT